MAFSNLPLPNYYYSLCSGEGTRSPVDAEGLSEWRHNWINLALQAGPQPAAPRLRSRGLQSRAKDETGWMEERKEGRAEEDLF